MRWTIPNILTVMRLLAAPGVAFAFAAFDRPYADWIAFGLFILAALTDYVDGKLARAWQQESNFGRMLDPIADKAMVVIALAVILGLLGRKALLFVPVDINLLREVFVSGLRAVHPDRPWPVGRRLCRSSTDRRVSGRFA